jgi:hypothetical protein
MLYLYLLVDVTTTPTIITMKSMLVKLKKNLDVNPTNTSSELKKLKKPSFVLTDVGPKVPTNVVQESILLHSVVEMVNNVEITQFTEDLFVRTKLEL